MVMVTAYSSKIHLLFPWVYGNIPYKLKGSVVVNKLTPS
jgi:hypothetical protein